jgi:hypothetical protein
MADIQSYEVQFGRVVFSRWPRAAGSNFSFAFKPALGGPPLPPNPPSATVTTPSPRLAWSSRRARNGQRRLSRPTRTPRALPTELHGTPRAAIIRSCSPRRSLTTFKTRATPVNCPLPTHKLKSPIPSAETCSVSPQESKAASFTKSVFFVEGARRPSPVRRFSRSRFTAGNCRNSIPLRRNSWRLLSVVCPRLRFTLRLLLMTHCGNSFWWPQNSYREGSVILRNVSGSFKFSTQPSSSV